MATAKIGEVSELCTVRNVSDKAMRKFAEHLRSMANGIDRGSLHYLSGGIMIHSQEMGQIILEGRICFVEK